MRISLAVLPHSSKMTPPQVEATCRPPACRQHACCNGVAGCCAAVSLLAVSRPDASRVR